MQPGSRPAPARRWCYNARMDTELAFASASALADRIRRRRVSPVELVDGYLERIDRLDGQINSFVTLAPDRARHEAHVAATRAGSPGAPPFDGVPIAIKDLHRTAGITTTFGTASMAAHVPDLDDEHVARLRRAGFIVLGKTNVPEWGTVPVTESRLHGAARNPWAPERTPGGSSGGAAAGLAAGLIPVAHGSDGAGSIRIPASSCGLVGLKPTRGRVSLAPLFGDQMAGLVTPGPITRHVADAAALLDAMRGYAVGDPYWAPPPARPFIEEPATEPGSLRIGVVTSAPPAQFDAATTSVTESVVRLLDELGHAVEPVTLPTSWDLREQFMVLWTCGLAALPVEPGELEPFNAHFLRRGRATSAPRLLRAISSLQLVSRAIVGACWDYDAVLSPTLTRPPPPIGAFADLEPEAAFHAACDYVGLTPIANITGQPAISLPLGWSGPDGQSGRPEPRLPVGVMLTGRPAEEATLLRLGGQLERAVDWTRERPPVS